MSDRTAFVAYPAKPLVIGQTIEAAVSALPKQLGIRGIETWKETDVAGQFIGHRVLERIEHNDCLVADISELNFNVTYEIGFAIGKGKPLLLTRYSPLQASSPSATEVGIFDTIGYKEYQNSAGLADILRDIPTLEPIKVAAGTPNFKTPLYLIEALFKTDSVTRIVARVKKARLSYRSFDPNEQPRLSAFDAIQNVAQSHGVLLHLLPGRIRDAKVHNLRVAFLAGLATGMEKVLLILQDGDEPVPLDYRDLVVSFRDPAQIDEGIADFATRVTEALQASTDRPVLAPKTFLERLTLGSSSAENELRDLAAYYLQTDAFNRAARGEVRLIVGRKGSGKTALFLQVRDLLRGRRTNVVLDLRPEGYKLLRFKEVVLDLLEEGTRDHTLTAFWEYLLLLEICRKLLESDEERHMRDGRLFEPYKRLATAYQSDEYVAEGDFSERVSVLLQRIRDDFNARYERGSVTRLSQAQVTELIYRHDLSALRREVVAYLGFKESLWLLFDNLDKGWPTHGIRREDLIILRTLLEATRKLERELSNYGIDAHAVIFLRNDVFELLVEETPDRGKDPRALVDWTDPEEMRELVRRRIVFNDIAGDRSFADVWSMVCVSHIAGEETSQYMIERSLMRPRALLDLISHCRSCAVNRGHPRIEADDIRKGLSLYSTDLVREIGLEIRDVLPEGEDVLYVFIDVSDRLDETELRSLLATLGLEREQMSRLVDILLWYGVLGLVREDAEVEYIYSLNYDMRLLLAKIRRAEDRGPGRAVFGINPAFWAGLGIRQSS
jgi:hypothetical protein